MGVGRVREGLAMATAVVEERQLLKSLRWWDGFTIALANPGFLLGSLLLAYGALGVVGPRCCGECRRPSD